MAETVVAVQVLVRGEHYCYLPRRFSYSSTGISNLSTCETSVYYPAIDLDGSLSETYRQRSHKLPALSVGSIAGTFLDQIPLLNAALPEGLGLVVQPCNDLLIAFRPT